MQIRNSHMEEMHGARCGEKGHRAPMPLSECTHPLPPTPLSVFTNWKFSELQYAGTTKSFISGHGN